MNNNYEEFNLTPASSWDVCLSFNLFRYLTHQVFDSRKLFEDIIIFCRRCIRIIVKINSSVQKRYDWHSTTVANLIILILYFYSIDLYVYIYICIYLKLPFAIATTILGTIIKSALYIVCPWKLVKKMATLIRTSSLIRQSNNNLNNR